MFLKRFGSISLRRKVSFSLIGFGVFVIAIPLAARALSLDWFQAKDIQVSVTQREAAGTDIGVVQHYLIEINKPKTWLFTGLFVSPGDTLHMRHQGDNKPIFVLRVNGQEFKADGSGGPWSIRISNKKCNGCLFAKPSTHLYVSAEEPAVIRLEIRK